MFWLGEGKTPWSHDYVGSTHYPMKIPKHLLFRFPSFFLLLTVFLQPQFRSRADYTATLNPGTTWGTWEGWGCSLASGWTGYAVVR